MFELPHTKRVRRGDLASHSGSSSPSLGEHEAVLQANLQEAFSIEETNPNSDLHENLDDDTAKEDAFEFRLFAAPMGGKASLEGYEASRIAIRSASPEQRSPGLVVASRPNSYYFANPLPQSELEKFKVASVSGEDVLKESRRQWPGNKLPWRLVTIEAHGKGKSKDLQVPESQVETSSGRQRDGKKRRIAIRRKAAAVKSKLEQEAVEKAAKEAAEKAKRTLRNRGKKVKKKARDKAKKSSMPNLSADFADAAEQSVV